MKQAFRLFVVVGALLTFGMAMPAYAADSSSATVPTAKNLSKIGQIARDKKLPIILVYSADHCAYCEILENEILKPMIISGDYTNRVLIYKLNIDDTQEIRDFNGDMVSISDFSMRHNVFVTPTMLFLGANGKELHERILGINTVEMFGGRVDNAIEISLAKLRNQNQTIAKNQIQPAHQ